MIISIENSTWNNVGDGFYQIAIEEYFRREFPQHDVVVFDGPIERAFRPTARFSENAFRSDHFIRADLHVLSGPIFNESFFIYYEDLIKSYHERGELYAFVSVHGSDRGDVTEKIKEFLKKYPPAFMSTRDPMTYGIYKDLGFDIYDGLCFAYCSSQISMVPSLDYIGKSVAYSFYSKEEPSISAIKYDGDKIEKIEFHGGQDKVGSLSRHLQWRKNKPAEAFDAKIIRLIHDLGYKFSHLNFAAPNSYLSYNPKGYLSIYKSVDVTASDRIHACVASLSFGKKVYYFGDDPRDSIFDRPKFISRNGLEIVCDIEAMNEGISEMQYWISGRVNKALAESN